MRSRSASRRNRSRRALNVAWRAVDLHGLLAHFVANERLAPLIARLPGRRHQHRRSQRRRVRVRPVGGHRARNRCWWICGRWLGPRDASGRSSPTRRRSTGTPSKPPGSAYQAADGHLAGVDAHGPPSEHARQTALILYYRDTDLAGARTAWREQSQPPAGPTEIGDAGRLRGRGGVGHGPRLHSSSSDRTNRVRPTRSSPRCDSARRGSTMRRPRSKRRSRISGRIRGR